MSYITRKCVLGPAENGPRWDGMLVQTVEVTVLVMLVYLKCCFHHNGNHTCRYQITKTPSVWKQKSQNLVHENKEHVSTGLMCLHCFQAILFL